MSIHQERSLAEILAKPVATVDDSAWASTLSRGEIYARAKSGELASIKVGRRVLIRTDALRELLGIDQPADPKPAA